MAAATNQDEVREILRAVTLVKERLGVRTVLGVSNVSFGLPARPLVNSTFLAAAFGAGLDMPILNPLNVRYRDTVATFRILNGQDTGCRAFLEAYANASRPLRSRRRIPTAGVVGGSIPGGRPRSPLGMRTRLPLEEGGASTAPTEGMRNGVAATGSTPVGGDLGRPSVPKGCPVPITEAFTDAADTVAHLAECVLEGRKAPVATATERLVGDPRRPGHHQRYLRSHPRRGRPEIRRGRVLPAPAHGLRRSRESRLRSHSRPRSGSRRKCR